MTHNTAVGVSALTYYIIGLVLLVRRWHWQGLLAGAFPLIATFAIAALPVTGRILHDAYADELSLSQEETSVSGIWQIASSIKLIWPSLGTTLFLAAGWSILRYFHFVRRNSYFGGLFLTLLLAFSLTSTAQSTLNSPKRAAEKVRQAALQNAIPPKYFGLSPEWVCVAPTVPTNRLNEEGGTLQPADPYISFGVADRYVVLWNHATARPLRIPAEQVRITPEEKPTDKCIPSTRQARNGWQNTGH
ncbi:hypothetical protein [Streptomyces sp. NPDC048644]|uniref:hypothetical protein n=1 Tax=Streptomyces sp. NPDC048644 TaxID=3365582 RepID=UPI0037142A5E